MAGSRLEKLGTVFTRTRNLLRARVLSPAQKPLWFDVYAAFPPLREPLYREPRPRYGKVQDVIPPILYQEDEIRATFYQVYGNGPKVFELSQLNFKSTCQRFVEKFNELQKEGKIEPEKLFEETGKQLLAEGIILRRKGTANVAQQTVEEAKTWLLGINNQTLLEERQEQKQDQEEQHLESTDVEKENPLPS
ncbi:small ribosomal subunit protein mS23 [Emydura macquarii macquarii]|uniref:small ribosomal subunit protein mS23 n=1 Tax=Emydura macquarii macquarii TaxID=1129001 RepID=UPI00352A78F2